MNFKTVLVISPHADDAEVGCGGLIKRLTEQGAEVYSFICTNLGDRAQEVQEAKKILGIKKCMSLLYPIRTLPESRKELLDRFVKVNQELRPDLVLCPTLSDTHQDHQTVAQEAFRAFKYTTLWGYELPWNMTNFQSECFVELQEHHLQAKIDSFLTYKTQSRKRYYDADYLRSLARTRGVQIGYKYAESYQVIHQVHSCLEPQWNAMSITNDDWKTISDFIKRKNIKTVTEFGAGISTELFEKAGCFVTSYETDLNNLNDVKRRTSANLIQWTGKEIVRVEGDVAFIDGPHGGKNREYSYQSVAESKVPYAICHDFHRKEDRALVTKYFSEWRILTQEPNTLVIIKRP